MNNFNKDLKQDATEFARTTANASLDKASELAGKAGQTIDRAMDAAGDVASDAAAKGKEAGKQLEAVAGNFRSAIDKSLVDQPMATLAVAAAVGIVIGALWKS